MKVRCDAFDDNCNALCSHFLAHRYRDLLCGATCRVHSDSRCVKVKKVKKEKIVEGEDT